MIFINSGILSFRAYSFHCWCLYIAQIFVTVIYKVQDKKRCSNHVLYIDSIVDLLLFIGLACSKPQMYVPNLIGISFPWEIIEWYFLVDKLHSYLHITQRQQEHMEETQHTHTTGRMDTEKMRVQWTEYFPSLFIPMNAIFLSHSSEVKGNSFLYWIKYIISLS